MSEWADSACRHLQRASAGATSSDRRRYDRSQRDRDRVADELVQLAAVRVPVGMRAITGGWRDPCLNIPVEDILAPRRLSVARRMTTPRENHMKNMALVSFVALAASQ